MIEALTCPRCYGDGYRALGAHGQGVRVACSLCGTVYVQPSAARLRAHADQRWRQDEPSYNTPKPAPSYYSLEVTAPRSLWGRLRAAWRGALAGWRGAV